LKVTNLNLNFSAFVSILPDANDPDPERSLKTELDLREKNEIAQKSGESQQFVVKTSVEGRQQVSLDPGIIENIQKTYMMKDPTVIMVIMGPPGLGKSTLLNYMTQFCTESLKLPTIFKTDSTGGHTTIDS